MVSFPMNCIHCGESRLYVLQNGHYKCSRCRRKFSKTKWERVQKLWRCFVEEIPASQTAKAQRMHFSTVQNYYKCFRKEIALISDREYQQNTHRVSDYDEYLYLPKSLSIHRHADKIEHFLTLAYGTRIYNLMMPSMPEYTVADHTIQQERLVLKYLQFNKVAKLSTSRGIIVEFWEFLEQFILKYRGVSKQEFALYLKEAEWRFNGMPQIDPAQCLRR